MGLKLYQHKRNFSRTLEPTGRVRASPQHSKPIFVVQKHAARRLHYDFRLEMEGVLKSWAVPKGFPTQRADKRLAIEVEDHPIEYGDFEGTIPEGNYGAGTVMVWDRGTYKVSGDEPVKALRQGKLHLILNGRKLKGEWTLVRTRIENSSKPQWLLMKTGSDTSPFSGRAENQSALTSRTLEQIAHASGRQWQSNRAGRGAVLHQHHTLKRKNSPQVTLRTNRSPMIFTKADFVEPMKALTVDELPTGANWLYEMKFDGVRV